MIGVILFLDSEKTRCETTVQYYNSRLDLSSHQKSSNPFAKFSASNYCFANYFRRSVNICATFASSFFAGAFGLKFLFGCFLTFVCVSNLALTCGNTLLRTQPNFRGCFRRPFF